MVHCLNQEDQLQLVLEKFKDHCDLPLLLLALPASEKSLYQWKDLSRGLVCQLIECLVSILADNNSISDMAQFDLRFVRFLLPVCPG
jgi:hypothetical protein